MRNTVIAVLIALILGAGGAAWFMSRSTNGSGTTIDSSQAAVIKEIRQLGRLETSSFTIEKVIEAKKAGGGPWRDILFGDKILLIAHGEVVAGLDLSGLTAADVREIDGRLHLKLPAPQIFSVRIDNEQTRVYDRDQGLLTRGDKDLESEARLAAEQSIRDAACEAKILDDASENAAKQLKAVLSALGFKDAVIDIPPGSC
ncbi:MAG TPA: DUF4230 domain-containing protein [Candidatus Eisenbacteria bacterium]|nr:DUF4230 domain-containing protein [Candidatus Eisenbacteria bacterium]